MDCVNQWPEEIDPIGFFTIVEMFAKARSIPFQTVPEQYSAIKIYEIYAGGLPATHKAIINTTLFCLN